jgi:penicillin-binding protein 2
LAVASSNGVSSEFARLHIVLLGMVGAFVLLAVALWRVQVLNASEYVSSLDRQSVRRVRLPGIRGNIYDRHGMLLAGNRPSYSIAIYVEELRKPGRWAKTVDHVDGVVDELAQILGLPREVSADDIRRHMHRRTPLPLLAWRDIGHAALARWAEGTITFPGVDIYTAPVRSYPEHSLAAHVLGYVGRSEQKADPNVPYHFYLPEMGGKAGIEMSMNERLAGTAGGRLIRVDASGFKYEDMAEREPHAGDDVWLTLDAGLQRAAESVLEGQRGAVVVLDPRNGDVLALASSPTFDLDSFTPSVSQSDWDRLNNDADHPLFNRAVAGVYPPGSIFKPMVSFAAIENGRALPSTEVNCPGFFALGDVRFHCWRRSGHGLIAMRKAIEQSCNAYFCELGLTCGYDRIYHMAEAVGLGRATGIALPYESGGLLPDSIWKERVHHDSWRSGDTCNVSIGQGALLVTPLQMAMFAAAIANGGYVYRPRLMLPPAAQHAGHRAGPVPGELVNDMHWSPVSLETVRGGMHDVVHAEHGTGRRAQVPGLSMAGKTGTAEYGPRSDRKKHTWMIAFAPFEAPRYAVALVIEDGVSGGITAAPRVSRLLENAFAVPAPSLELAIDLPGEEDGQ